MRLFGCTGAIGLFLGVALGALGAHMLRSQLSSEMLGVYETAVRYQIYHSIALLLVAVLFEKRNFFRFAGYLYISGIVLFSGSLYALSLSGGAAFGFITPFGGLTLLAGHACLFIGFAMK